MKFALDEVNFEVKYEGYQNCSKTRFTNVLGVLVDLHI